MDGVRKATIKIDKPLEEWAFLDGVELKCAVAHGLINAKKVMDAVKNGTADFHFLEVMACPGGCLGGGGQPIPTNAEIRKKRAMAIYAEDSDKPIRKSHENPEVLKIYKDFLGKPNGELSHHLLHTTYQPRERF
jgi:NADH-quinone oxidoreductase subunit G/[NiFe] hydrogenase diaphorase moiety small subunit/NADP-reducing hydrogenase subunit HndD